MQESTHVLLHNDLLKLSAWRLDQSIFRKRLPSQEDVEHEGNTLETQQVISGYNCLAYSVWSSTIWCVPVGGDFNFELGWFLHAIDNRTVRIRCLG
jgi:hypothetical protein